jgi:hypothetical protein
LRLNVWTSIVVFLAAVVYIVVSARLRPGREVVTEPTEETERTERAERTDQRPDQAGQPEQTEQTGLATASASEGRHRDPTERAGGSGDDEVPTGSSAESGTHERRQDPTNARQATRAPED